MSNEALAAITTVVETAAIQTMPADVAAQARPVPARPIPIRTNKGRFASKNAPTQTTDGDNQTAQIVPLLTPDAQKSPIATAETLAIVAPQAAAIDVSIEKPANHRHAVRNNKGRFTPKQQQITALPPSPTGLIETPTTETSVVVLAKATAQPTAGVATTNHRHAVRNNKGRFTPKNAPVAETAAAPQSETTLSQQNTLFTDAVPTVNAIETLVPAAGTKSKRDGKGRFSSKNPGLVQQVLPIEAPVQASKIETVPEIAAAPAAIATVAAVEATVASEPVVTTTVEPTAVVQPLEPIKTADPVVAEAPRSGEVIEFPSNDMAVAKEDFPAYQERLKESFGSDIYTAWFGSLKVDSMIGSKLVFSVPTRFLKSWIQSHYIAKLLEIWQEKHPSVTVVEIQVRSPVVRPAVQAQTETKARPATGSVSHLERPATTPDRAAARTSLDARHTFANFICGESNRLALNAAKLAASPDAANKSAFNPLYIHAGVGLGKTHLLQAIAADNPGRALYVTAESFMYNFIGTMRNRGLDLKSVLANVDILLMDDLQFLQGKGTVTELALIVNAMIDAGRQVIVAADRSPGQLDCQDERLASRLKSGYCVEIGNPEEETRLGILNSHLKSDHPAMVVPDDVVQHLSSAIVTTGRDLVGALNHLNAATRLSNQPTQPVTMEMAEAAVRQITEAQPARRVRIEDIQKVVARFYKISKDDMISARRTSNVVRPRQIAIYLAKSLTLRSLPEIGRRFGGRDHTTILHAVRKIEELMGKDEAMENDVSTLKRLIGCPA